MQMPHLAPTYAAVLSLSIVAGLGGLGDGRAHYREAGRKAVEFLDEVRTRLYAYFLSLRVENRDGGDDGGDDGEAGEGGGGRGGKGPVGRTAFRMQHDGEVDVRATYCVLAPCYLLGLLDDDDASDDGGGDGGGGKDWRNPLLSPSVSRHVASCQTYEGGFGAEPHNEAHGGYAFCALSSLRILGRVDSINVDALSSWLSRRQMGYEGGFSGRTNKLVDGCYSFWQGGATAVLDGWLGEKEEDGDGDDDDDAPTFDEVMLQRYILLCAQDVNGGLRDKPSKSRDFYHSCYNLSGLSVAQHALGPWPPAAAPHSGGDDGGEEKEDEEEEEEEGGAGGMGLNRLFGDASVNVVGRTDPVINIRVERVRFMLSRRLNR